MKRDFSIRLNLQPLRSSITNERTKQIEINTITHSDSTRFDPIDQRLVSFSPTRPLQTLHFASPGTSKSAISLTHSLPSYCTPASTPSLSSPGSFTLSASFFRILKASQAIRARCWKVVVLRPFQNSRNPTHRYRKNKNRTTSKPRDILVFPANGKRHTLTEKRALLSLHLYVSMYPGDPPPPFSPHIESLSQFNLEQKARMCYQLLDYNHGKRQQKGAGDKEYAQSKGRAGQGRQREGKRKGSDLTPAYRLQSSAATWA